MKIRPIKVGHAVHCPWCKADGQRMLCQWHLTGANKQSCAYHLPELQAIKTNHDKRESANYSEADYQSWMKL